jgi:hypothetical protein
VVTRAILERDPRGQLTLTASGARLAEGSRALLDHEAGRCGAEPVVGPRRRAGYPAPGETDNPARCVGVRPQASHFDTRHDADLRQSPLFHYSDPAVCEPGTCPTSIVRGTVEPAAAFTLLARLPPRLAACRGVGRDPPCRGRTSASVHRLAERPMLYDPDVPMTFHEPLLAWVTCGCGGEARLGSVVGPETAARTGARIPGGWRHRCPCPP